MYYKLKGGKLKSIVELALKKSGTVRKLERLTGISKSSIHYYLNESRLISDKNLRRFEKFLSIKLAESYIQKRFLDNWRQVKGGKSCVASKKKNGTFVQQLKKCRIGSSSYMKKLHKTMKKTNPEEYYISQYEKFKKIGEYKYVTNNGEKVRNILEKEVADILKNHKIKYEYEPYINVKNKAFSPPTF